jgi:hypothetical protein
MAPPVPVRAARPPRRAAGARTAAARAVPRGRRLQYAATDPEQLAEAIAAEIDRELDYRPVESDGAARAASLLAELL